ncbi:hypothetical protein [Tabrizicola sp.]|uniref:hypothetical protein n=1 Tax=Tabrizicola sp. TaxID=2005166 RepID=UPI003F417F03
MERNPHRLDLAESFGMIAMRPAGMEKLPTGDHHPGKAPHPSLHAGCTMSLHST